jgi:replication factor C subunit 1
MKRLQKEVVIMDEVDGLSGGGERGGIGELADLIRKSNVPIICIANQLPPKLKPLQNACQVIKFHRPVKSTIATALLGIAKKEGLTITKAELEGMCETSGNDIRSILNRLQFDGKVKHVGGEKDAMLRLDLFSATQRLIGNKRLSLTEAEDLVYVDYGMVPLMVQEGYLGASRGSLEDAVIAAEEISFGDLINQRLWRTQDWSLLPHVVHSTVAAARTVQGPAPFQIFPQLLGKNSKRAKHRRLLEEVGRIRHQSVRSMRLYELEPMEKILLQPLQKEKPDIKGAIQRMDAIHLTRDHLVENITENLFYPTEIPTKVKTAFTREYNKGHQGVRKVKEKDPEDDLDDLDDLEEDMEELDL